MSLAIEYEEKMVTEKVPIETNITCDICGAKIPKHQSYFSGYSRGKNGTGIYSKKSEFDVCSDKCLLKKIEDLSYFFDNFAELEPNVTIIYSKN